MPRVSPTPFAAVLSILLLASGRLAPGVYAQTNFIVVLADDQRHDAIGITHSTGGPAMPILASIARAGMVFRNARTVDSLCAPSRASLLTGLYVHNHGVLNNAPPNGGIEAFDDSSTIATWLHDAGYRTGLVGKYINDYYILAPYRPPGWDDWHVFFLPTYYDYDLVENDSITHHGSEPADYSTDVLADRAVQFIEDSAQRGKPFFLLFAPKAPHEPATPAPRHVGAFSGLAPWRPASWNEADMGDKPKWARSLPEFTPQEAANLDAFARHQMETDLALDEAIGRIMDSLIQTGTADDTTLIYTSDNGYAWGEHRWDYKACAWEECVRVPLAVWKPGLVPAGTNGKSLVLNVDLAPTIAELAGISTPSVNGRSMVPLFSDGSWRTTALAEHWPYAGAEIPRYDSIADGRWKLVDYLVQLDELYDLDSDPLELTNVAGLPENSQVRRDLLEQLNALRDE